MNLMDLKPKESSFFLKAANRSFKMNPITLSDEIWIEATFGVDGIQQVFNDVNIKEIARVIFRLMDIDDKRYFKAQEITVIDEEGNESSGTLGGVDLLRAMISGNQEKLHIMYALLENIGVSRPDLAETETKKKVVKKKRVTKKKTQRKKKK